MKPTAWLINAARGPLVDEAAVVEALSSGRLQAAGLDVQLREPPDPANPLLHLRTWCSARTTPRRRSECYEKMSVRAAKNILEAFDGTLDPGFVVNPEALPEPAKPVSSFALHAGEVRRVKVIGSPRCLIVPQQRAAEGRPGHPQAAARSAAS